MSGEKSCSIIGRLRFKNILIIVFILVFAAGLAYEIWKHSDDRMKKLLESERSSFEACVRMFSPGEADGFRPTEASEFEGGQKVRDNTSLAALEKRFDGEAIADSLKALDKAGILRITVEGAEVRFYLDVNMGICYIDEQLRESAPEKYYYPQKYLDENKIDGSWYRFGDSKKK